MQDIPVDLIERLRNVGDAGAAESVADIARCLAMAKRYFEEYTGATLDTSGDSPEFKCLAAVDTALDRIRHPLP